MVDATQAAPAADGRFMGGDVNALPVQYPQLGNYGVPPPGYPVQIQGTGGMPSKGAGLISGIQAGQNIAGNAIAAHRGTQQYNAQQAARKASADATGAATAAPGAAPPGVNPEVHQTLVQGAITGLKNLFGMGAGGPPATSPGGATQAIPSPPQSQVPQNGPNGQGSPAAMQEGGPVTPDFMSVPPMGHPAGSVGTSHQAIPGISGYEDGGPVQDTPQPVGPIQGTGGMPSPGAGLVSGMGAGQQIAANAINAHRGTVQYNADQNARQASAAATSMSLQQHVESIAHDLHSHALNDDGQPNHSAGLPGPAAGGNNPLDTPAQLAAADKLPGGPPPSNPAADNAPAIPPQPGAAPPQQAAASPPPGTTPPAGAPPQQNPQAAMAAAAKQAPEAAASVSAVAQAAQDPNAKAGIPQQSPDESNKPHSLTPDYWDNINDKISKAAQAAAMAGQDPNQVFHSLTAMRNSFFQGQVLKNLSAANMALQTGDMQSVEKAMKNVYYYFPDGKDLSLHHSDDGTLQYQDPINPFVDKDGKPTQQDTGKPNFVNVDAQHIQLLGQAALDPMTVANTLQNYRMIPFNMRMKEMEEQSKMLTAQGRSDWGQAAVGKANADLQRVPYQNLKDLDAAYLDRAKAQSSAYALKLIQAQKLDPAAQRAVQQTNQLVDNMVLGPPTQAPLEDKDGNPSLSPSAGRVVHDPARVPKEYQNINAVDLATVHAWASGLVAANPQGMTPQDAASVAGEAYRRGKATHKGPDGKDQSDVMVDRQQNLLHVWDNATKQWRNYPMASGSAMPLGSVDPSLLNMASGGASSQGAIPPQASNDSSNPPSWVTNDDADSSAS